MVSYILTGPVMNMAVQGLVAMEGGLDKMFHTRGNVFLSINRVAGVVAWAWGTGCCVKEWRGGDPFGGSSRIW